MQRFNGYQFYAAGASIHPLGDLRREQTRGGVAWILFNARLWLNILLQERIVPIRVSKGAIQRLATHIDAVIPPNFPAATLGSPDDQLDYRAGLITAGLRDFEAVFSAELQDLDAYLIDKQRIYVTSDLIEKADLALDEATRKIISGDAIRDFKESGRCLAFNLATASGFHAMRATETVLRQWHQLVCKPAPKADRLQWAQLVNELKSHNADKATLAVLDQIRDLHRNPLMHPEIFLSDTEAVRLFSIAQSAIDAMAEQIGKIPAQTAVAPTIS